MTKFHLNQEFPRSKPPINSDGTDADGRIGLDLRRTTRDEATELMAHHLSLAHTYYQATPENEGEVLLEVERILSTGIAGYDGPEIISARAFLTALNKYYADLKDQDDNG